jgi:hypothetical protein
MSDVHQVYAIRYGHHDRKAAENYIGGDPHDIIQPLAYFVWAITGPAGTFIVDTGFSERMIQKKLDAVVAGVHEETLSTGSIVPGIYSFHVSSGNQQLVRMIIVTQ